MQPLIVLCLCGMCQCGLHTLLWSHISILMHLLAAKPHSTAGRLFPSQYLCGIDLAYFVFDGVGLQVIAMLFFIAQAAHSLHVFCFFLPLLPFFWFVLWGWGFVLIKCRWLSPGLILPTSFNNNNNNNNNLTTNQLVYGNHPTLIYFSHSIYYPFCGTMVVECPFSTCLLIIHLSSVCVLTSAIPSICHKDLDKLVVTCNSRL